MDLALSILSNRVRWLINLRWVFCFGTIGVVWLTSSVLKVVTHPWPLYVFTGIISEYAAVEARRSIRVQTKSGSDSFVFRTETAKKSRKEEEAEMRFSLHRKY